MSRTLDYLKAAVSAATTGDIATLAANGQSLQDAGWGDAQVLVLDALERAVGALPGPVDPNLAADLARRIDDRYAGRLELARPTLEALTRAIAGEDGLMRGIPRNVGLVYALLITGQIVHEGHLTLDQAVPMA